MPRFGKENNELKYCSFCGRSEENVKRLIAGSKGCICNECVIICNDILKNSEFSENTVEKKLPKPKEIYDILDEYVIGQADAKRSLAVAVYNHYKRIEQTEKEIEDLEIQKSNILMIGSTGCGKTLLAQTLSKILEVPFVIVDASSLTEAGYVGRDTEDILFSLLQAANGDIDKTERGIIYIDEVDKITRKLGTYRDISGEGVQQALLKILEGSLVNVPLPSRSSHDSTEFVQIDTRNILFICGGAFNDIDKIIEARTRDSSIGFGANIISRASRDVGKILKEIHPDDLLKAGLIPEFIGRLPVIVTLDPLDEDALIKILTEPKNALIKQYQKLMALDGTKLKFEEDALRLIAQRAIKEKTGARGLRTILEKILRNVMFNGASIESSLTCTITKENILFNQEPKLRVSSRRSKKVINR